MSGVEVLEIGRGDWIVVVAPGISETIAVPSATLDLVEIAEQGPAGPPGATGAPGPRGEPGLSGANYVHNQAVPAATWNIAHNLARFPSVTVIAGDTELCMFEVISLDGDVLTLWTRYGLTMGEHLVLEVGGRGRVTARVTGRHRRDGRELTELTLLGPATAV